MQFEFLSLLNSSFFQCHESARVGFRSFVCTHFVTWDIKFLHSTINSTTRIIHENSKMYFSWGHFCVRSPSNGRNCKRSIIHYPPFKIIGISLRKWIFVLKRQQKTFFFKWIFVPLSNKLIVMSHIHRIFYSNKILQLLFKSK